MLRVFTSALLHYFTGTTLMSLTSFIDEQDVRERFNKEFVKPTLIKSHRLLAPSLTKNPRVVGTAFDYLMRFHLKRLNPQAVERPWIAENAWYILDSRGLDELCHQASQILTQAKERYTEFLTAQTLTDELLASTLLLAKLDGFYRSLRMDENLQQVNPEDIRDLRALISAVDFSLFQTSGTVILNPEFKSSSLVKGADADLIIDDLLIDIKTVKELDLQRRDFNQLVGYYILSKIDQLKGVQLPYNIKRLGIYFSRHAYLYTFDVEEVVDEQRLPEFLEWFQLRAGRSF